MLIKKKGMGLFMQKDTSEIVKELGLCPDFQTFYNENKEHMVTCSLSALLGALIAAKGLKKSQVIKKSELAEIYAYQIFSGLRMPDRKKLLCLAIGMGLNIDETQQLLKCAGYSPLYVKLPFDSIILYGLCKNFAVVQINELLYEYGLETLG